MNQRKLALLFVVSMMVFLALPAAAWNKKDNCNGGWIRWRLSEETLNVSAGISQFYTSEWRNSIEAAARGWNQAPASNFEIHTRWTLGSVAGVSGDGSDDLAIPSTWNYNGYAAVTKHRWSDCGWWPDLAHYTEVDVLLNPNARNWDKSTNPVPSDGMQNTTLILQHEFGHVLGLDDENGMLATMNSGFPGPMGGPIGNNNAVQPLGNDLQGVRDGYGWPGDERDVAASAVYYAGSGVSRTITAPSAAFRGSTVSFQFTILSRGKTSMGQETIPVYFYLSADRNVTTADMFLGNATIKLADERSTTGYVTLLIPDYAPTGNQYLGWYTDPDNVIVETDELNNGVALVNPTYVSPDRMPTACFTATPTSGYSPLSVSLNAGCSSDPDGDALTYTWDFGDGSMTTGGPSMSHTFWSPGYHQVLLTVTDPWGASTQTYRYISVACRPGGFCPEDPY
jgi:PKD repeat protein